MHSIPYSLASRGFVMFFVSPSIRICPESARWAPDRTFVSVDLPAPLPPTRPTTSPGKRSIVTSRTAWTPPNATLMFRISTSGVPDVAGAVGAVAVSVIVPASASSCPPPIPGVDAHDRHEDDRRHHVDLRRVEPEEAEPVLERLHDESPEDRPRDRPDPACERRPPDHRRRADVQLVARAEIERAAVEAGRGDRGADRAEDPHEDERPHDDPAGVDAGQ